jgi:hypothetical protein
MDMKKNRLLLASLGAICLLPACEEAKNLKEASVVTRNDTTFIRVVGERRNVSLSLLELGKLYMDTGYWPIPKVADGKYDAGLPASNEHGGRKGYILINRNKVVIKVSNINKEDSTLVPNIWNGEYELIR